MIDMDGKDFEDFSKRAAKIDSAIVAEVNKYLLGVRDLLVPVKGTGPIAAATPKRTGKLRTSTIAQIKGGQKNQKLEVRQGARNSEGAFYGYWVRAGTDPHTIVAKNKPYLHFKIGEQWVKVKKVNHPGTKANPYHEKVIDEKSAQLHKLAEDTGVRLNIYLAGGKR